MSIGSRIKELRLQMGITQEELANSIGVTKGAIANYENEVSSPKIELMYKLFKALKCDANYLYQDEMDSLGGFTTKLKYAELEYIKKIRTLDEYGKQMVNMVLEQELKRINEQLSKPNKDTVYKVAARGNENATITQEQVEKGLLVAIENQRKSGKDPDII